MNVDPELPAPLGGTAADKIDQPSKTPYRQDKDQADLTEVVGGVDRSVKRPHQPENREHENRPRDSKPVGPTKSHTT